MALNLNYPSTTLLVRGTGTNDSVTPLDLSLTPKTLTASGNAKVTTSVADPFGDSNGVLTFDGTGDYFSTPDHAELELGGGNFTLRAWVRFTGYPASNAGSYASTLISKDVSTSRSYNFYIGGTASSLTSVNFFGAADNGTNYTYVAAETTLALDTWYLIECIRSGNLIYLFKDGTLLNAGGTAFSRTIQNTTTTLKLGALELDATYKFSLNGQLAGVEVIPGVALHTASYTAPTAHTVAGLGQLLGNVTEGSYSYISKWLVKAWKSFTATTYKEQVVTGTTYTVDLPTLDPYVLACAPYIDGKWEANKIVTLGQFYTTSNPETSAHLWEVTTAGTFAATEATWNLSGTTTQGTATMTYVGVLPNPSIRGPKIPS